MTSSQQAGLAGLLGMGLSLGALGALGALAGCGAAKSVPPPTAHGGGPPALVEAPVAPAEATGANGASHAAQEPAAARRRALEALERDVAAAELRWDWPAAFARLDDANEADPDEVAIRRTRATIAFEAFVDDTIARIVAKGSAKAVLGDRRGAFLVAVDPARLPADVGVAIYARERRLRGVLLVFDQLEEGALLEPPTTYWAFGAAPTRSAANPALPGKPLRRNASFVVVARGKLDGVPLLAIGAATDGPSGPPGPLERLESISGLVVASAARPYETTAYLPPDLQPGDRVLAAFAPWPTQLVLHEVLTVRDDALSIRPLVGGAARAARRDELRADFLPSGVSVLVPVNATFKRGLLQERLDDEQAVVTLDGARQTVPVASLRVEARTMPAAPRD
jgi:hypothetical protein